MEISHKLFHIQYIIFYTLFYKIFSFYFSIFHIFHMFTNVSIIAQVSTFTLFHSISQNILRLCFVKNCTLISPKWQHC